MREPDISSLVGFSIAALILGVIVVKVWPWLLLLGIVAVLMAMFRRIDR